jgi:hypothetical protein
MLFQPMPLSRRAEPFNHPDWIFEIKWLRPVKLLKLIV